MTPASVFLLFRFFAFFLGACIGSFLNVVIYRLPLDLSVNEPRRSFCPHCRTQIPFSQNIPLVSWLVLRGKCARCGAGIAFRYFAVELLTAMAFLLLWIHGERTNTLSQILPLWVLVSLFISATFIDFEHFIIPNEITLGGTAAGVILSGIFPGLMGQESHAKGLAWSLLGAGVGFALLWVVVELGKLAFGKRKLTFDPPADLKWVRKGEDADFTVGDDTMLWSEIFSRDSDRMVLEGSDIKVEASAVPAGPLDGEQPEIPTESAPPSPLHEAEGDITLEFRYDRLIMPGKESEPLLLDNLATITGKVRQIVVPREAMGRGDVKFIACIGAFLGWQAVLFTIVTASVVGSVVGILFIVVGRKDASGKIPFGPYLAAGALAWIFTGPAIVAWYLSTLLPPQP